MRDKRPPGPSLHALPELGRAARQAPNGRAGAPQWPVGVRLGFQSGASTHSERAKPARTNAAEPARSRERPRGRRRRAARARKAAPRDQPPQWEILQHLAWVGGTALGLVASVGAVGTVAVPLTVPLTVPALGKFASMADSLQTLVVVES